MPKLTRAQVIGAWVIAGAIVAFAWYKIRDRNLSDVPPRSASQVKIDNPSSQIAVSITLPFDRLTTAAEAAAPKSYSGGGNGPDACQQIGPVLGTPLGTLNLSHNVCAGTKYDYNVTRGPITVSEGPNNTIRISVPLHATGHGGFRGTLAAGLSLDAKSFDATAIAHADIGVALQPDWCPRLQVSSGIDNLQAKLEIVSGTSIGIADLIGGSVQDQVKKMGDQVAGALRCEDVQNAVKKVWASQSLPITLPGDANPLYINIDPVGFGFSGVKTTSSAANLLFALSAVVFISDKAATNTSKPLPPVQEVPTAPGSLQIALPLRVSYPAIEAHIRAALTGLPFSVATPAGPVEVRVSDVTVYPSQSRLAIGAHVAISPPGQLLATRGWIYVTAQPGMTPNGTTLTLQDISYSRIVDSSLVRVLTVILNSQIQQKLNSFNQVDLSTSIEKAKVLLKAELLKHSGELSIDIGEPTIQLDRVIVGNDDLYVEGQFRSGADAVLSSAH